MSNLMARLPSRPTVVTADPVAPPTMPSTTGGEFELRGMGESLTGDPYIAVDDATESGRKQSLYVSPNTPVKDIYADAPQGTSGDFSASRRKLLDSIDDFSQDLQGKTPDVRGSVTTQKVKGYKPLISDVGGRSPHVAAGEDYNSRTFRRFNEGETSAKGSTAMRANRSAHVILDRNQKKEELKKYAKKIDTILSDMSAKAP